MSAIADWIDIGNEDPTFQNVFVGHIRRLLHSEGESFNLLTEGKQNIGKSGSMLTACKSVDPEFDESRIVFTTKQYVDLLKNGKLPVGSAYLFDECGDELGSRSAMRPDQRRLMAVKQADRILGLFGCFTLPKGSMADKQLRQLAHATMTGLTKNKAIQQTFFRYKINTFFFNFKTQEPIYRYPVVMKSGKFYKVKGLWISKPPVKLWHAYSNLKLENLNRIYEGIHSKKDIKEKVHVKEDLTPLVDKVIANTKFYATAPNKKTFNWRKIKLKLDVNTERAREIAILAEERASLASI